MTRLRSYAELLGEGRSEEVLQEFEMKYASLRSAPAASKQTFSSAYNFVRSTKDFGDKDK